MIVQKVPWRKRPSKVAEWSDIRRIVERHLVRYRAYYAELADL